MKVSQVAPTTPFLTKDYVKSEALSITTSAALSAGLTLAMSKGKNVKGAMRVAGLAAGFSALYGIVQRCIVLHKEKKISKQANQQIQEN